MLARESRKQTRFWLLSAGASAAVFAFTLGAQWFFYLFLLHESGGRLVGPAIAAIASGLSVLKAQHFAEQRKNSDLRRFHVIAEANHHIRNALQVLVSENHPADHRSAEMLRDAVHRIEWVLTDVLPGLGENPRTPNSSPE